MKFSTIASIIMAVVPSLAQQTPHGASVDISCPRSVLSDRGTSLEFYRTLLAEACNEVASCDGPATISNKVLPPADGNILGVCTNCPKDLHPESVVGPCKLSNLH